MLGKSSVPLLGIKWTKYTLFWLKSFEILYVQKYAGTTRTDTRLSSSTHRIRLRMKIWRGEHGSKRRRTHKLRTLRDSALCK